MIYKNTNYSFFGTCANDYFHARNVIKTIILQTIKPKEVILVDSGDKNNYKKYFNFLNSKNIDFIYVYKKLPRVKALNLAISKVTSEFCFRFDTRTRFEKNYAEESLRILLNKKTNLFFVGGVPEVIPEDESFSSIICSEIMRRSYVFFYPRHRRIGYSGYASSIYLGCFKTNILKKIKYREDTFLISEDSLLASDFISENFKLWLSSNIKLKYVARSSLINILRLFNTYGFCRFNTILSSGKLHSKKRYFYLIIGSLSYFIISLMLWPYLIFLFPFVLIFINIYGELFQKNFSKNLIMPLLASLCQLSWIIGFAWAFLISFKINKLNSNFIR